MPSQVVMSVSYYEAAYEAKKVLRSRFKNLSCDEKYKNYYARYQKAQAMATSFA